MFCVVFYGFLLFVKKKIKVFKKMGKIAKKIEALDKLEEQAKEAKTPIQNSIEECKKALSEFQAKQKTIKAEKIRKELLTNASPEEATKIQKLSTTELLAKANPKPRIDVFSKEKIESLVLKNIQNRQKNIPKTQKITISEDKIKQVVNELYKELDKRIDKLLKN